MIHFKLLVLLSLLFLNACGFTRYVGSNVLYVSGEEFNVTPEEVGIEYFDVDFKNTDGDELHGWMIPGSSGAPLILYFHGNMSNVTQGLEKIELMHDLGFSVFTFEYRGYGESEGHPLFEDDFYRDARAAMLWLERHGWDESQIIYYGHSMGSAVAIQLAIEQPPLGLLLESSFSSFSDLFKLKAPFVYMFGGWTFKEFNNISKMPKLKSPIIFVHGEEDDIAPSWMSNKLYDKSPLPKQLILVPGANHIDSVTLGAGEVQRALANFSLDKISAYEN